jgi:hypothetical protein
MYQYVVIKRWGVQKDFHENQSDTVAYHACTDISRKECRKTDTERSPILQA